MLRPRFNGWAQMRVANHHPCAEEFRPHRAHFFFGEVNVHDVTGNKDFELHAGQLTISVDKPEEYGHVDMSVSAGEADAEIFGDSQGGLFRSISHDSSGKYSLRAHVGTGQLSLR